MNARTSFANKRPQTKTKTALPFLHDPKSKQPTYTSVFLHDPDPNLITSSRNQEAQQDPYHSNTFQAMADPYAPNSQAHPPTERANSLPPKTPTPHTWLEVGAAASQKTSTHRPSPLLPTTRRPPIRDRL
jgi:hypothetical protein